MNDAQVPQIFPEQPGDARFVKSVYKIDQLPEPEYPEIAFAGRSNVGKSSLINKLINRKNLVKISSRPGKTQSLNFFLVERKIYLVDLPGYGYAKVPQKMLAEWQELITAYLLSRGTLKCVVVIIDLRHALKAQDRELIQWLQNEGIPFLPVYTKRDKLKRNQQQKQAASLDAALNITAKSRILFSAKTGEGKDSLLARLDQYVI